MKSSITVRMYNQDNLGDCFLLKIEEESYLKFILIDFGSYTSGNNEREIAIANNIKETIGMNSLTIVLTHQHKDHLSGFINAKKVFDKISVDEVWLSFLDNPLDKNAEAIKSVTVKFWQINDENKTKLKEKVKNASTDTDPEKLEKLNAMLEAKDGIDGFYAEKQSGGQAITNLRDWSNDNIKFLVPGEIEKFSNTKVYVLGPPKKIEDLKKLNPSKGDAVHSMDELLQLNNLEVSANIINDALYEKRNNFPFSEQYYTKSKDILDHKNVTEITLNQLQKAAYKDENKKWRKIDFDWLNDFGRMSLHMDNLTNNSSLVLAFELPVSKKVLLFAGDAQIGNWKSWFNVEFKDSSVTSKELLSRTVFYKAGHHSSHNATLLEGLNLMNSKELVIMIPVNEDISSKFHFAMLQPGMLLGYNRKSKGRVLRSDKIFQPNLNIDTEFKFVDENHEFAKKITVEPFIHNHLYIEYTVS
jgi:beta-lactamase superfamily II metal-dependent hydrolase